jgi:hypothetical protein
MPRTEARLDATGAVTRRRPAGAWAPIEPRSDWARVDATTEAEIERQAADDDAGAAMDAAAWARRVRRRAGLSQAEFARRIGILSRLCAAGNRGDSPRRVLPACSCG